MAATFDMQALTDRIGVLLDQHIRPVFKGQPKITLFVRFPDDEAGRADVMVSNDSMEGVQAIFERSMTRDGVQVKQRRKKIATALPQHKLHPDFVEELLLALLKSRTDAGTICHTPPEIAFSDWLLDQIPPYRPIPDFQPKRK